MRWARVLLAVVVVLVAAPAWAADFEAGVEAYKKGDYATALEECRPLAERGAGLREVTLHTLRHTWATRWLQRV